MQNEIWLNATARHINLDATVRKTHEELLKDAWPPGLEICFIMFHYSKIAH